MMRRYMAFLLMTTLLLSLLIGCTNIGNNSKEYRTAVIGYSDSIGINGLSVEYEIRDYEGFKDKKGPRKATYRTFDGAEKTIDLSEIEGEFVRDNYYPIYEYGNTWFNSDGIMERYALYGVHHPSEISCSEEEAIQIAQDFMKNIVNLDEYVTSVFKSEDHKLYCVNFYKYADGIKTTEDVELHITYDGILYSYVADMLGQFTTATKNPFDMDKVEEVVYARLEELTKDLKDKYDKIEYSNEEFRLTRLKDGSLAILYTGEIVCSTDLGEETMVTGELIEMLIMQ